MDINDKFWIGVSISIIIPGAIAIISLFIVELENPVIIVTSTSLILISLSLIYRDFSKDFETVTDYVDNQAVIKQVWEANFYDRWRTDVENANRRVDITYFDNKDPRKSTDKDKSNYYESFGDVVKRKSTEGVEFRRLIRANPNLDNWVEELIEEHEGTSRYSLACVPDPEPESGELPHVSVQLIDDEIVYFVAVGQQMEGSTPRDMFVRSTEMNSQWGQYYENLWGKSFKILRRGTVQDDEYSDYKEHIKNLKEL